MMECKNCGMPIEAYRSSTLEHVHSGSVYCDNGRTQAQRRS